MQVKTQPEDFQDYLTDASNMPGGNAERVFLPESEDEIAEILREANAAGIPVTIAGARTGTVGGAIPFGGYVVSMERFNKIEIDRENARAVCGAGVILADLQKAADAEGLLYPPDPTEWSCQIGGTIATNASGSRSFKYGATRGFVEAINVVLASGGRLKITRGKTVSANGEPIELTAESGAKITAVIPTYPRPNVRKNVSGYYNALPMDAIDLFIGSEGTLGVITQAELRLLPKWEGFFSGIVFFEKEDGLLAFVDEARKLSYETRSGGTDSIDASMLEYFDGNALRFIAERFPETPENMAGAVYFEQATNAANEDELLEKWNELLEKHSADLERSWFTTTDGDAERLRAFRHALPVSVNERVVRNGRKKIGTDMSVPDDKFAGFLRFYKEILDASGIDHVIFGHIGDNHLHANLLPKDDAEAERARHIYGRCIAQAIMLGGCVSAEHGIGKLKSNYLYVMMGERYLNEMGQLKRAFDPNGILGRGNMFDAKYLEQ